MAQEAADLELIGAKMAVAAEGGFAKAAYLVVGIVQARKEAVV
jgi:hypothetical protein